MQAARYALLALCLGWVGCSPHDCSRGMFFGGGAGTRACPAASHYYAPRYLPEQELRPYLEALDRYYDDRRGIRVR